MQEDLKKNLRVLRSDLKTLNKLDTNPGYLKRLIEAKNVADALEVSDNEHAYYCYQLYLRQLKGVDFLELTALERFSDIGYYTRLLDILKDFGVPKKESKYKKCKIIRFKGRIPLDTIY